MLLAAQGVPGAQIAERVGCSEPTVIRWRSRFAARDLAGLVDEPRSGKPDTSAHSSAASPSRTATTSSSATLAAPRRSRTSSTTTAELLQRHLPTSRVVKAFNHIYSGDLTEQGQAPGTPGRRALVIAGDDADARTVVAQLIDSFGFDVVELEPLSEGWRIQRDTPGYGPRRAADELRADVAAAKRYRDM